MVRRKILIRMVIIFVTVVVILGGWFLSQTLILPQDDSILNFNHPALGPMVAHAADGIDTGCVECHKSPIPFTGCNECHLAPATTIGNSINFEGHHAAVIIGCSLCHGTSDDARYVTIPTLGHGFCEGCHATRHGE